MYNPTTQIQILRGHKFEFLLFKNKITVGALPTAFLLKKYITYFFIIFTIAISIVKIHIMFHAVFIGS
jgi:hypothetical protein